MKILILNNNKLYYLLNWVTFIAGLTNFITGLMKFVTVLTFIVAKIGLVQLYWLNQVHRWAGVVAGVLILIHIIFHWRWILKITRKIFHNK